MTEFIASHLDLAMQHAPVWGFILIFVFMTVESSFIPFPSEVVMIPAGFLAYRGLLSTHIPWLDLVLSIVIGLAGAMAGAYINYGLSVWLGRPFLHKYGKYFFLKEQHLDRAEEIFRKYGDLATFVCRLLPAIRQLISIPAGLSRMNLGRFSFFTALGAGIWFALVSRPFCSIFSQLLHVFARFLRLICTPFSFFLQKSKKFFKKLFHFYKIVVQYTRED